MFSGFELSRPASSEQPGNSGAHSAAVGDSTLSPLSPGSDRLYHQWLSTVRVSVLPSQPPATATPLASWRPCSVRHPQAVIRPAHSALSAEDVFVWEARWTGRMRCPSRPGEGEASGRASPAPDAGQGLASGCRHLRAFLGVSFQGGCNWETVMGKPKICPSCRSEVFFTAKAPGQMESASLRDLFSPHCPCGQVLAALGARCLGLQEQLKNSVLPFLTSYPGVRTAGLCAGRRPGDGDPVGSRPRPGAGGAPILLGRQARKQATPT